MRNHTSDKTISLILTSQFVTSYFTATAVSFTAGGKPAEVFLLPILPVGETLEIEVRINHS
jgi:hypothetical protein